MSEKVLMKGNDAIAEAAIRAGCRHYFGYPITPQNELAAYMSRRMPQVDGVFVQAESEIGAIHMVLGASCAGKRTMTSSSSPGISLKAEGLSYLAGCDLPAVLVNIQRGGPGLGGIQPSQADYFQSTRSPGHGDFHMITLAPGSVQEMYDHTGLAFDLADKYRMTVMILADGLLGQMMEPVAMGKESSQTVSKDWSVGINAGQKRGKNIISSLYLQPEDLEKVNRDRYAHYDNMAKAETRHEGFMLDDAEIVVTAYGASSRVVRNAIKAARAEGIKAGLLRPITVWPFPKDAFKAAAKHAKVFISVEMSMGQMIDDVKLAIDCSRPVLLVDRPGGTVPTPEEILAKIKEGAKI